MDITVADLFSIIGEQQVEIRALRSQVEDLSKAEVPAAEQVVVRPPIKK